MSAMIGLGRSTIDSMQGFSKVLLPISAACTAATGAPAGAAARQVATAMFSSALLTLIDRLLVPMVYAYAAASAAWSPTPETEVELVIVPFSRVKKSERTFF